MPDLRWSAATLGRRLGVALLGLSLVLLLVGTVLIVVLRRADQALTNQVDRTYPARLAASNLLTSLVDQETGLRGYALTGDKEFLAPYRRGLVNEQKLRAELEQYVRPRDPARLSLLNVDAAITAWRDQYASLRISGTDSGASDATIEYGRQLFERVRTASSAFDAQLAAELKAARAEASHDRHVVTLSLIAIAVIVGAAIIGLRRALQTSVLRPLWRLAAQVAVVSEGDHGQAIQPVGPPDIRGMASSVESMRVELVTALAEVDAQRRAIEQRAAELTRSNADLEQFAYVASHDLQEPLRKVASFCQLLSQRYRGQLDERADQYIDFAVDGAKRMQLLIEDLLRFSRVGRTSEGFGPVDLRHAVEVAWDDAGGRGGAVAATLDLDIDDRARNVTGDAALLQMLLVNLLGNSTKYRREDVALVTRVTAVREGPRVCITVADNGIGIPPEYAEKVFVIFQRLHGRDEYSGTGIGLALAKKIVEFHGGTIGIAPSPLGGACISFSLPASESSAE